MFQRIVIISAEYELYLNNGWICVEMSFPKCSKECFLNLLYDKWKRILTPEFATSLKPYKAGLSVQNNIVVIGICGGGESLYILNIIKGRHAIILIGALMCRM